MTRYKFIKFKVNELYAELNIQSYPIDPFEIINHFSNIILIPYSRYMQDFNYSPEQMLKMTKSKLGCCQHQISYDINHKGIYSDALVVDNFQKYLDDRYDDFLVHKKLMDAFKIAY